MEGVVSSVDVRNVLKHQPKAQRQASPDVAQMVGGAGGARTHDPGIMSAMPKQVLAPGVWPVCGERLWLTLDVCRGMSRSCATGVPRGYLLGLA